MWGIPPRSETPEEAESEVLDFSESCVRSDIAQIISKMYTPRSESPTFTEGNDRTENAVRREMIVNIQDERSERVGYYSETIMKSGLKTRHASTTDKDSSLSDCMSIPMVHHLPNIGRKRNLYYCECCRRSALPRNSINRARRLCRLCERCKRNCCFDAEIEDNFEERNKCSTLVPVGKSAKNDKGNQVCLSEEEKALDNGLSESSQKTSHSKSNINVLDVSKRKRKKTFMRRFITKITSWQVTYNREFSRAERDEPRPTDKSVKQKTSRSSHTFDFKEPYKISTEHLKVVLPPSCSKIKLDMAKDKNIPDEDRVYKSDDLNSDCAENTKLDDIFPIEKNEYGSNSRNKSALDADVTNHEDWSTTFWATVFSPFYKAVSFFIAFFLEMLRFILEGVLHPLFWRSIQLFSDHIFKPFLSTLFQGFLQPTFVLLKDTTSSIKDVFLPISQCLGEFFKEVSTLCRACRLVEVNNYGSGHVDHNVP